MEGEIKKENRSFKGNGGTIYIGDYVVHFDEGSLEDGTEVKATKGIKNKDLVNQAMINEGAMPGSVRTTGTCCDIELDNSKLLKHSIITLHYNEDEHGSLKNFYNLQIIQEHEDETYVLQTFYDEKRQIIFAKTKQFSLVGVVAGVLATDMVALGMVALPFLHAIELSITNVNFLQPGDITQSDHQKFQVDMQNMELRIDGKKLKGQDPGWIKRPPKRPKEWIKEDILAGYCIDWAYLFGSLLIERGYPVRVVTGKYAAVAGKVRTKSGHMWVEVVIDGEIYVVDTLNPNKGIKLIPRSKAYSSFCVDKIDKVLWAEKVKDGYIYYRVRENYDPNWWHKYKNDVYELDIDDKDMWKFIDKASVNLEKYKLKLKSQYLEYDIYSKSGGDSKAYHIRLWEMKEFLELRELQIKESYHLLRYLQDEFESDNLNWLGISIYTKKNIYSLIELVKEKQRANLAEINLELRLQYEKVMTFWERLYFEEL